MNAIIRTGIVTAALTVSMAVGQTRQGNANDPAAGQHATAQGTQTPRANPYSADTPKWNPGFGEEIPNKELSGNTPRTNSSLQKDGDGDMGNEYFGWLGLIGLAGLFG